MNRWYFALLAFLLLASLWTAAHPPQRWDFFPVPVPVDPDELGKLNQP